MSQNWQCRKLVRIPHEINISTRSCEVNFTFLSVLTDDRWYQSHVFVLQWIAFMIVSQWNCWTCVYNKCSVHACVNAKGNTNELNLFNFNEMRHSVIKTKCFFCGDFWTNTHVFLQVFYCWRLYSYLSQDSKSQRNRLAEGRRQSVSSSWMHKH